MIILALETSCDDTCSAVLDETKVLGNVISSQINLHKQFGGVMPDVAKRAHQDRIDVVIMTALKKAKKTFEDVDVIAVTKGPGLAIALSVGVNKARELAIKYNKKLVAVNHIEGHILSNLINNRAGIEFPALSLTASGGHTKLILVNKPIPNPSLDRAGSNSKFEYEVVGETLDDAAGEALDKAAKLLGLGYPGGPVIERIALKGNPLFLDLPKPIASKKILDYSFSGLKTSFYYKIKDWPTEKVQEHLADLAASFQNAVFETLLRKYQLAIEKYQPKTLLAAGGVLANRELRKRLRKLAKNNYLKIFMPIKKWQNTDNAAMIGVAGYFKAMRNEFDDPETLDRDPRYLI
jgi:N6-L-threonylcarbamoyladenine synthase